MAGWKKIRSKIAFQCPHFDIMEDDILQPDDSPGTYYYVKDQDSAAIIAETEDGKIVLVGQSRYPIGNIFSWELPTGGGDGKNSPLENAQRELEEETGFIGEDWQELGYFYPWNGVCTEKCALFIVKNLTQREAHPESSEDIQIMKKDLSEIREMIGIGEISDGITIAAILKYILFKEKEK